MLFRSCTFYTGQQLGAVEVQVVKRTGFDEGFDRAFVQTAAVHTAAEVEQASERAALLARRHDGINRLLTRTFDGAQTVANDFV